MYRTNRTFTFSDKRRMEQKMKFTEIINNRRVANPELDSFFDLSLSIDDILSELGFEGGVLDGFVVFTPEDEDRKVFGFESQYSNSIYQFKLSDTDKWMLERKILGITTNLLFFKDKKEVIDKILSIIREFWLSYKESTTIKMIVLDKVIVGETPVTQEVYEKVMGENPSLHRSVFGNLPVENVSFKNAIGFCNKLSELHKLEKCYYEKEDGEWDCDFTKMGYRLPNLSEWEYVCKANSDYKYSGSNNVEDIGWYSENSSRTHEVKEKQPNGWGIYDMSGNVREWCWDIKPRLVTAPKEVRRYVKGGSWKSPIEKLTWDFLETIGDWYTDHSVGFRVFRNVN